ncbi:MAG: phosphodiester glycosidase family protein [Eubacteriales bacterium]|nr:phosphodiester glycosidase family protein [Eubacteriales bacterium]
MKKLTIYLYRVLLFIIINLIIIILILFMSIKLICSNISPSAKELFATTILETGQLKFLANIFLTKNEINEILNKNTLKDLDQNVDTNLINLIASKSDIEEEIIIEKVSGPSFFGKMMIIKNPQNVFVGSTYPFSEYGDTLENIIKKEEAIAGVNGGLYVSNSGKSGIPLGVVVQKGIIQSINLQGLKGLHLIGLDNNNILKIIDLQNINSKEEIENIIKENNIRDAICFQEEINDKNNHFVKLIINGIEREFDGLGSGANPRTAIGQRADGAILLLTTDGRGSSGHIGATIKDLIKVMKDYKAINAANIDGGSSSCMYYDDHYEMSSITFYYYNSTWRIPTAFVVKNQQ